MNDHANNTPGTVAGESPENSVALCAVRLIELLAESSLALRRHGDPLYKTLDRESAHLVTTLAAAAGVKDSEIAAVIDADEG